MHWSSESNAGFSDVSPWIELNENHQEINVEKQKDKNDSLFNFYQQMIQLRNHSEYSETLIYGDIKPLWNTNENVISYLRRDNNNTFQIIVNLSDELITQEIDNEVQDVTLNNYENPQINQDSVNLRPYECLLIKVK